MSFAAIKWATSQTVRNSVAKAVLMALAGRADQDGYAFPRHRLLAAETGLCPSSVRNGLKTLEADGLIRREPRYRKNGGQTSNKVWLLAPKEQLRHAKR